MAPILEVKNLTHTYSAGTPFEHKAIDNMNFSVERGEFIGIIGHTGSGKSTLMQHLEKLVLFPKNAVSFRSSGPYRIASATSEELWLEPNPNWWGEPDSRGYDRIFCQKIGT